MSHVMCNGHANHVERKVHTLVAGAAFGIIEYCDNTVAMLPAKIDPEKLCLTTGDVLDPRRKRVTDAHRPRNAGRRIITALLAARCPVARVEG